MQVSEFTAERKEINEKFTEHIDKLMKNYKDILENLKVD
jgi:hypothetical protein